jgi:hypothetical protein
MSIFPNQLTLFNGKMIRVLGIFIDAVAFTYVEDNSFPTVWPKTEFFAEISNNDKAKVQAIVDPYAYVATFHEHLTKDDSTRWKDNYALIEPLLSMPDLFFKATRNKVIKAHATNLGRRCENNIRKQLKRFWKRGMNKNAVLPDRYHVGNRGVSKPDTGVKRGRDRSVTPGVGVNIDGEIKDLMKEACDLFLKRNASTGLGVERSDNNYSIPSAYSYFALRFQDRFPDIDEEDVPTSSAFKHYFYRKYPVDLRLRAKVGELYHFNNFAELSSDVNYSAIGPAYRYELDATPFDVRLTSSKDRRIPIKRVTLILIIDTWSRMIVGYYFGLDKSSKATTAMALKTVVTDKVELCKKHGVEIEPYEWPCNVLSKIMATDRAAEYLSKDMEKLVENYYGIIEQGPARKSRLRPVVEQTFNQLHKMIKPMCDGNVYSTRSKKAGGGNAALEARFTLDEMQAIVIKSILSLNNDRTIHDYTRDVDIEDNLPSKPLALWNWGLVNRTGRGKVVNAQDFFCSLLPTSKVTSSDKGLKFKGMYYKPMHRIDDQTGWFVRGYTSLRPKGLEFSYNANDISVVYLKPPKGQMEYIKCELTKKSRAFNGLSLIEAQAKLKNITLANNTERQKDAIARGTLEKGIEKAARKAREAYNNMAPMSDKDRLAKMDEYSSQEKTRQNINRHDWNGVDEEVTAKVDNECQPDENDDLLSMM